VTDCLRPHCYDGRLQFVVVTCKSGERLRRVAFDRDALGVDEAADVQPGEFASIEVERCDLCKPVAPSVEDEPKKKVAVSAAEDEQPRRGLPYKED
jgi:hypothetical protein